MYVKVGLNLSPNQKEKIIEDKFGKSKRFWFTLKLSKLQISKQGGFLGTCLAGLAGSLLPALLGGKGLVLPGTKRQGRSYYFEKPVVGKGLILGPNFPFKNIPILALIL